MTTANVHENWFKRNIFPTLDWIYRKIIRSIPSVYIFLILFFLVGGILDQIASKGQGQIFTNPEIQLNIIVRSIALGIVAVGQSFVITGGSIDLSVAYTISITAVMSSYIMNGQTANILPAMLFVFGVGAIIGTVNGLLVTKAKVNPFIATLGTSLIIKGIINGTFSNYTGSIAKSFEWFAYARLGPIPVAIIILFIVFLLGWFLLSRTKFGAHLYGVGGNSEVARLSGVRSDRVLITAHIIASLTAVLSGLFLVSLMGSAAPWVGPEGSYDLKSIATTVIGGTALAGGKGSVWGTLAGVLIFGVLATTFNQLRVNSNLQTVFQGAIIILAVASYTIRSKKEAA